MPRSVLLMASSMPLLLFLSKSNPLIFLCSCYSVTVAAPCFSFCFVHMDLFGFNQSFILEFLVLFFHLDQSVVGDRTRVQVYQSSTHHWDPVAE